MWHVHVYTSLSLKCKILSHTHGKKSRYRSARLPSCLWSARAQLSCVRAQPSPRAGSVCSRYTLYVVRRLLRRERMPVRLPATEAGRRATPVLCPHAGGWQVHGHALGAGGARHHRWGLPTPHGRSWRRSRRLRPRARPLENMWSCRITAVIGGYTLGPNCRRLHNLFFQNIYIRYMTSKV